MLFDKRSENRLSVATYQRKIAEVTETRLGPDLEYSIEAHLQRDPVLLGMLLTPEKRNWYLLHHHTYRSKPTTIMFMTHYRSMIHVPVPEQNSIFTGLVLSGKGKAPIGWGFDLETTLTIGSLSMATNGGSFLPLLLK